MSITETQNKAESLLYNAGILPVVTVDTVDQARRVVGALLEGGLTTIELTLRTPVALEALATLKREQPEITIGAGTVLNEHQLRQSIDAGADFLITPGTPPTLAQLLADAPIPAVPGAATATELLALMVLGLPRLQTVSGQCGGRPAHAHQLGRPPNQSETMPHWWYQRNQC